MEHDGCVGCKYEHESADSKYCLGCKQNAIDKYAPMTNADRIRSMTDEELGKAMFNFILNAASNPDFIMSPQKYTDWLQSEAE